MPYALTCPASLRRLVLLASFTLLNACAQTPATVPAADDGAANMTATADRAPASGDTYLLLVSIDGFRADYLDRGVTPRIAALAAEGVRADALRPAFPSLTFPNHYTIVTGLYPDHHGIVHNRIEGDGEKNNFVYNDASTTADARWWGGEPIWVGAERRGVRTATMFWPGSDVAIDGIRPSHWKPFDRGFSPDQRVDTVLGWLDLPAARRPRFITLYFEQVDRAGHDSGPDSAEVNAALAEIDATLGRLLDGIAQRRLRDAMNLVLLSDHGQTASSAERAIAVDEIVDLKRVRAINFGVVAGFTPQPGEQRYAYDALLKAHPHMQCWRRAQIPARFHYGTNARIPPIVCLAEPGWVITTSTWLADRGSHFSRGEHGYDNALPDMGALFVANGPAFRRGARVPAFDNVDVYPLLARLLGIAPARNDGNPQTMRGLLREDR
ncbi:MAG TPA: ectonucleotide pyrophosphatase/phosphodiesterase [Tahibacter sp.]|uniref:alkaline phosphatase family protein n=1 Tax=Tahibacter sp. TaxID=2056211 RepID=UPI002B7343CD|nr:ectonucleotide pyrophosphatase/phosphodiesterase [Tahibacter sp.]HSX60609.1 ectonucleotide pyrophosphatase/phosphodiesterase [Tahibacter sp.]